MTLAHILSLPDGSTFAGVRLLVAEAKVDLTKNGKEYLRCTFCDSSASVTSPIWDHVFEYKQFMLAGAVIDCTGVRGEYNGEPQLNIKTARPVTEGQYDIAALLPSYEITDKDIEQFDWNLTMMTEGPWRELASYAFQRLDYQRIQRDKDDELPNRWNDFIHCPAAVKRHGNKIGGLFWHTMGVYNNIVLLLNNPIYSKLPDDQLNLSRLIFCALFHDIGKINDYKWETGIAYNDESLVDHRYMGISMFEEFHKDLVRLGMIEEIPRAERQKVAYTIACHHGQFGELQPKSIEDWLLHLADMVDAKVTEVMDNVPVMAQKTATT